MNDQPDPRLARLEHLIRVQDERFDRDDARRQREVEAIKSAITDDTPTTIETKDANRMELLDRLADRCPDLGDVSSHEVEWVELPEGDEALVLDRSGFIDGNGAYFMLNGDDVLAIGPMGPGAVGVVAIRPDGSRQLLTATPER